MLLVRSDAGRLGRRGEGLRAVLLQLVRLSEDLLRAQQTALGGSLHRVDVVLEGVAARQEEVRDRSRLQNDMTG